MRLRQRLTFWREIFFQHDVGIGAAKAKGTHARAARNRRSILSPGHFPWCEFICDIKRSSVEIDVRIDFLKVNVCRNVLVLDSQQYLEQAGNPGSSLQMANVRFD